MSQAGIFNQFKVHTQYSICEGANKIDDLAEFCKNHKISSLGICDSYNLCGALEFSEKISKSGTQPIIGSQINFVIDGKQVYVFRDGKAIGTAVTTGTRLDARVEITDGLQVGDSIIVSGLLSLTNGTPVQVNKLIKP